jgi:TPR repeat protein
MTNENNAAASAPVCVQCGAHLEPPDTFCGECGAAVTKTPVAESVPLPPKAARATWPRTVFLTLLILAVFGAVAFVGWRMLHKQRPPAVAPPPQPAASSPQAKNVGVVQEFALPQPAQPSPSRVTEKPAVLSTPTTGFKPPAAGPSGETPPVSMPPPAANLGKSYLGVYIGDVFKNDAITAGLDDTYGVLVYDVVPGTAAAEAGLRAGDILTEFNHHRIPGTWTIPQAFASLPLGSGLTITLVRNGVRQEVQTVLKASPDSAEIFRRVQQTAEQGDPGAQVEVGKMLCRGIGVARDPAQGLRWFQRAADQRFPLAYVNIAAACFQGNGVPKNEAEGFRWLQMAASLGHSPAVCELGVCYENGRGVARNEVSAAACYRTAAGNDHREAQVRLGLVYEGGRGVLMDYHEALLWFEKAARAGFAEGQFHAGRMELDGRNGKPDPERAAQWFRLAAEQGHPRAQTQLAILLEQGLGVTQNTDESIRWYRRAAAQNEPTAIKQLERLGKQ